MKLPLIFFIIGVVFLFIIKDGEVSAQSFLPGYYGGGPISYSDGRNDDDFGFLLAILLLASRRGGNCGCGNCGCNNARTVPVPYPIPFPTNNAVITTRRNRYKENDDNEVSKGGDGQTVNVITQNVDETMSSSKTKSDPKASSSSSSSGSSNSGGGRGRRSR